MKIFIYLLIGLLSFSCKTSNKSLDFDSKISSILLEDFYLYEVIFKNKSEDYYGLFLSDKYYTDLTYLNKIINSSDFYLVNKVSFYTYFDMKEGEYLYDDFEDCKRGLDYKDFFKKTIEDNKVTVNIFKISGDFYSRKTYSDWYNNYSTNYININKSKKINVICAICK